MSATPKFSKRSRRLPDLPASYPKIEGFLIHTGGPVHQHTVDQLPTLPPDVTVPLDDQDDGQILPTVHQKACCDESADCNVSDSMGCACTTVATGQASNRIQPKTAPTNQRGELREQPGEGSHRIKNKLRLSWGSTQPTDYAIACDLENKHTARGDQKG